MKLVYVIILVTFIFHYSKSQVLIDSIKIDGTSAYHNDGIEDGNLFYTTFFKQANGIRIANNINIYDQSLTLLDSIDGNQTGRNSLNTAVIDLFEFNNKKYVYGRDKQFNVNVYRIDGNNLVDSTKIDLDTVYRSIPFKTEQVNTSRLRTTLYEWDSNFRFVTQSKVVDLDTNFNIVDYHAFDFSQTNLAPQAQSHLITGIFEIDSNTWHIHTNGALHRYNTQTHTIDTSVYLFGDSRTFYKLNSNEYLALGTVSFSQPVLGLPYTGMPALGYYRINANGTPIDTAYFLNIDNNAPGYLDFSTEEMSKPAVVVYDTNSIYVASRSSYTKNSNSPTKVYFFVVKTDTKGNEIWRYRWGGVNKLVILADLIPTPDKGVVLIGSYPYEHPVTSNFAAILIKLGPDGNISNVELDAPETVVSFYPNPVKDKLHYSFLPEANDAYFLEILDMQGKPVLEKALENEKGFIPVNLHTGFYLYHLKDADGKVQQIGKIVAE